MDVVSHPSTTVPLLDGELDLERRQVRRGGRKIRLTPKESALLSYLIEKQGRVASQNELLVAVWGYRDGVRSRTVETTVGRLRAKIEVDCASPQHLLTVFGSGYRFEQFSDDVLGRFELLKQIEVGLDKTRWITLHGPGGVGKTAVARSVLRAWHGESVFAEIRGAHALREALLVIARLLAVPIDGDTARLSTRLGHALAARPGFLLVIDNAEHVAGALGSILEQWVQMAPEARLLVISRQQINTPSEHLIPIPVLDVAVACLLLELRAREAQVEIRRDAPEIRALVEQLDCLPLAIEVLAPRLVLMSPKQALERVCKDVALLEGPDRPLRASFETSWRLLSKEGQLALISLSILPAPATLPLAEAILSGISHAIDRLDELRRHALIKVEHKGGEVFYSMLETIHAIATKRHQRPEFAPRVQAAREHLHQYCVQQAGILNQDLMREPERLDALEQLRPHLEAAFGWAQTPPERYAVANALNPLLVVRGSSEEREQLWKRVLEAGSLTTEQDIDARLYLATAIGEHRGENYLRLVREVYATAQIGSTRQRVRATWIFAGALGYVENQLSVALQILREVLKETIEEEEMQARIYARIARFSNLMGDLDGARESIKESLAISRAAGLIYLQTRALLVLALIEDDAGRFERALQALEAARPLLERQKDNIGLMRLFSTQGALYWNLRRNEDAKAALEEAGARAARLGQRRMAAQCFGNRAVCERDTEVAEDLFRQARAHARAAGAPVLVAQNTQNIAISLNIRGRLTEALANYDEALEAMRRSQRTRRVTLILLLRAGCLAEMGQIMKAESSLASVRPEESNDPVLARVAEIVEAQVALARWRRGKRETPPAEVWRVLTFPAPEEPPLHGDCIVAIRIGRYACIRAGAKHPDDKDFSV